MVTTHLLELSKTIISIVIISIVTQFNNIIVIEI